MTALSASDTLAISEEASSVVDLASKAGGFGNEIELEVNEHGAWKIRIFSCYEGCNEIELEVQKSGHLSIKKTEESGDLRQERRVSF